MNLEDMLREIHIKLKKACFTDVVENSGVSAYSVNFWRNGPPGKPSLLVFCRLARYFGFNPTIDQLESLL